MKALVNDVSKACGGLPLALKVVGSSLFGKTNKEDLECIWLKARDALKGDHGVMGALKWSYDCLSKVEKLMFVDIACVFHGWEKEKALEIWRSCKDFSSCCGNWTPDTSLRHLMDNSLVVLDNSQGNNVLTMHGLLQDMGRGIGMDEGSHLCEGKAIMMVEGGSQNSSKVRAMSLTNCGRYSFDVEKFTWMLNLYFLILDGCDVHGNLGSISKELRYLQWNHMPQNYIPPTLNLSKLISLDFSGSTNLAKTWIDLKPDLKSCPNLLRLNLSNCTSITTLSDSIGLLSKLKVLDLTGCGKLRELPDTLGQLTALEELRLGDCGSLEALPDSITALSQMQRLYMHYCPSLTKLPAKIGLMTGLTLLSISLATQWLAVGIGQLNMLKHLMVRGCTDEAITALDSSGTLKNLHQLSRLQFNDCSSMTKLPETIGLLANLDCLELWGCEKVRELPNSIGQLKVLTRLFLRFCSSLEALPESLGALTSLHELGIVNCASITELPSSIGHLISLRVLHMQGCGSLQSFPDSLRQLNGLARLEILDCGSSLERLGLLRALQGLRIWGCTSITELSGSCLLVVDSNFESPAWIWVVVQEISVRCKLKEVSKVEANDCGLLRFVREDSESGRVILQRVHSSSCRKMLTRCM